jgi:hypothetical protein
MNNYLRTKRIKNNSNIINVIEKDSESDEIIERKKTKKIVTKSKGLIYHLLNSSDDKKDEKRKNKERKERKELKKKKERKERKEKNENNYDPESDLNFESIINSIISNDDEYASKKYKVDKPKTDKHKTDKHKTDNYKTDKHKTDKHKTDNYKTDNQKTDDRKTDNRKTDKLKTDNHKTDNQKTDKHKTDKLKTDKHKTDNQKTDKHKTDNRKTDKHKRNKGYVNKNVITGYEHANNKKHRETKKHRTATKTTKSKKTTKTIKSKKIHNKSERTGNTSFKFSGFAGKNIGKNVMSGIAQPSVNIDVVTHLNSAQNIVKTEVNVLPITDSILNSAQNNVKTEVNVLPITESILNSAQNIVKTEVNVLPITESILNSNTNHKNNKIQSLGNDYLSAISEFCDIYKTTIYEILENPKIEFRYFCYKYLSYMRNIELVEISLNENREAILIEYRLFPHLEFLIRNTIDKIGSGWSYSVVCGNLNYDYMVEMCDKISPNIKIIKTDYDNLNQSTYSELFATVEFWNLFAGEKLLIYQEDSCVFKSNINDFVDWDYVGAPWAQTQNDNVNCVGNGGFTLRTKQCMIDVINTISLKDTEFNSSTLDYMKSCGMTTGPEDVYFSLNMLRHNIGKVADWETARQFSAESIKNVNSFGGHNFWLADSKWKQRLYLNIVIQFKPRYCLKDLEHRGGWKLVVENLIKSNFYNVKSQIIFFDMLERYFIWEKQYECENEWVGIVHCTQYTPDYLDIINIQQLFYNINFIKALKKCLFIISLSKYVGDFLNLQLLRNGFAIKVIILKHPVDKENIILFDYDKYINNDNKLIIQIGQQLRKMTSIYVLDIDPGFKKIWLTGTKNFEKCNKLLKQEIKFLNMDSEIIKDDVEMKYIEVNEYDELLSKNIIFVDLFDGSANNTVLECIIRNTPIIVNKLFAIVEYLGEDYPLYFHELDDVKKIVSNPSLILEAHEYLKTMDKREFEMDYFNKKIIQLTRNAIIELI